MNEASRKKQLILKQLRDDIKYYQSQKDVQMVLRIKAIIAYEDGRNPDKIHMHLDVSQRTIKRWIKNKALDQKLLKSRCRRFKRSFKIR